MMQKNKLEADVERHGWMVLMVCGSEYMPAFAYTVGLLKNFGHPEIISFGLSIKTMHLILNAAGELVREGSKLEIGKPYSDFFENGPAEFVTVDPRSIEDYFGQAVNFYGTADFPSLQLVWTDRNNKFPWEDAFEAEFVHRQPMLDRNALFKFREEENLAVYTTRQFLEFGQGILRVVHDHDGDWQFLTGDQSPEDLRIVSLKSMVALDATLNEVFDLDYGEQADRGSVGAEWTRDDLPSDGE